MAISNNYILVRETSQRFTGPEGSHLKYAVSIIDAGDLIGALAGTIGRDAEANGFVLESTAIHPEPAAYRVLYVNEEANIDVVYSVYSIHTLIRKGIEIGRYCD